MVLVPVWTLAAHHSLHGQDTPQGHHSASTEYIPSATFAPFSICSRLTPVRIA